MLGLGTTTQELGKYGRWQGGVGSGSKAEQAVHEHEDF